MKSLWLALALAGLTPLAIQAQADPPRRVRDPRWTDRWERLDLNQEQRTRLRELREERRQTMMKQLEETRERMRSVLTDEQRRRLETLRQVRRNRELLRREAWRREMMRRDFDGMLWRRDAIRRRATERAWNWNRGYRYRLQRPHWRRYPI